MAQPETRPEWTEPTAPRRGVFQLHTFSSLRNKDYRYLWASSTFTGAAGWVQQVTLALFVADITDSSPFWVATVFGVRALPALLIGPLAGVAVDRMDRKLLFMSTQLFLVATAVLFAVGVRLEEVNKYHALVFSCLLGLDLAVNQPARQSLLANVVPKKDLTNAIALQSSANTIIRVIAPAVGIALITPFGMAGNFFVQAAAYLAAFLIVIPMRTPYREGIEKGTSVARNFKEGLRYIKQDTVVFLLIVLIIIPSVIVHATEYMLVIFAREILQGDEKVVLGILYVSIGSGALLATIVVASLGNFQRKGLLNMGAILTVTVLLILFGLSSNLALSAVLIGLMGLFNTVFRIFNNSIVQSRVPDALRGRITSIYYMDHGVQPLGIPLLGLLAVGLGAGNAIAIVGLFALGVTAFIGIRWRELWSLR